MTYEAAVRMAEELKGRFDAPFSPLDKCNIEQLYYEVLAKVFKPTSCQQCYHDAVIEINCYLRKNKRMKDKCNYRLRAGVIIMCPAFRGGAIFTNDNLTDEVAREYLAKFPQEAEMFQQLPEADSTPQEAETPAEEETPSEEEKPAKNRKQSTK